MPRFRIAYFTRHELESPTGCDPNQVHVVEIHAISDQAAIRGIAEFEDVRAVDIVVQTCEVI